MEVINFLNQFNLGLILKLIEILVVTVFLLYSVLTLRQVSIMNQSLVNPIADAVKALGLVQLTLGILVLLILLLL